MPSFALFIVKEFQKEKQFGEAKTHILAIYWMMMTLITTSQGCFNKCALLTFE